jgi:starch phosphorylase
VDSSALREGLRRLALSHIWTWVPSCLELLDSLPDADGRHPAQTVSALSHEQLETLLADESFMARLAAESDRLDDLGEPVEPSIAYFSMEFGISGRMPQYAGGLGVLAGDHLKSASELKTPLVGIGLFYSDGVFHQVIEEGNQVEEYRSNPADGLGAVDTGLVVEIPIKDRTVFVRVWQLEVGRVRLLLLDTDLGANHDDDRRITDQLYIGFGAHRVEQEMVLGVGGARALAALGWDAAVFHLNEGHAGFVALELLDRLVDGDLGAAVEAIRPGIIFTTHTPVPAGIDRFDRDVVSPYLEPWAKRWGKELDDLWPIGADPDDDHRFNMAAWCLRIAGAANGVSQLHGEVSRGLFAGVGIGDQIGFVTNGVHARTWTGPHMQALFDSALGAGWDLGDPGAWRRAAEIDDETLVAARRRSSRMLVDHVVSTTGNKLDPDALIIGFARRFAPYKRATLLLRDPERLARLLSDDDRPVHFLFSGKAHPSDDAGKSLVSQVVGFSQTTSANSRLTFLPDYDMNVAYHLVQGCDVWLNNPIRPREASGTSGEKAALNGSLNCSILDGWWAEMFDGSNGWAIPASLHTDPELRDDDEAGAVLGAVETVRDEYFGTPGAFNDRVRHAWASLGPRVTAARMLGDYWDGYYRPTLEKVGRAG